MDLVRERKLNYEINIVRDELEFQLLTVEFEAVDYSKIHAEIVVKKVNNKGFILEFPDYEEVPRSFLGLMNYYASIYFPFLNNNNREDLYYNYAYQDGIDFVNILKREFPNLEVNVVSKGQGATIGIVVSAVGESVDRIFISNVQNFDFKYIFDNNIDVGVYEGIREYARNYPEKEEYLLTRLGEIDMIQYCNEVNAEVYFGYSNLDEKNIVINKKLASMFKRKEVTVFDCEEENLHVKLLEKWLLRDLKPVVE